MIEHFEMALHGLSSLVGRVARGSFSDAEVRAAVLEWESRDARNSGSLADAAISGLEYQLSRQGLAGTSPEGLSGSAEEARQELRALQRLKAALKAEPQDLRPVEVAPAQELREALPGVRTFRMGETQIIATRDPEGWHLSVSHPERYPSWEELQAAWSVTGLAPSMWVRDLAAGGGPGGAASFVVHLFERPPADLLG